MGAAASVQEQSHARNPKVKPVDCIISEANRHMCTFTSMHQLLSHMMLAPFLSAIRAPWPGVAVALAKCLHMASGPNSNSSNSHMS